MSRPLATIESLNILPEESQKGDIEILPKEEIGIYAKQKNVPFIQHYGSSLTFDFQSLGNFDIIFIDGNHNREYVISDTVRTFPLLKSGGVMIWHDYSSGYEVGYEVIDGLSEIEKTMNLQLNHIEGTSLVYYIK